ncbi:MAG: hypothetical protein AAF862_13000, partial [Pseudomonadota bacterium]
IVTVIGDNDQLFKNVLGGKTVVDYSILNFGIVGVTLASDFAASTPITPAGLAGNDIAVLALGRPQGTLEPGGFLPDAEINAITQFVDGGGSLFLLGERAPGFNSVNVLVNQILTAVGSTMRLLTTAESNFHDGGAETFAVTGATPFADDVNTFRIAGAAGIDLGNGTAVISGLASNQFGTGPQPAFGTAVALETLAPVPVPAALPLFGSALGMFALWRHRAA